MVDTIIGYLQGLGVKDGIVVVILLWCTYWVGVGIYRVYFHPLAQFPGPKVRSLHSELLQRVFDIYRSISLQHLLSGTNFSTTSIPINFSISGRSKNFMSNMVRKPFL